jgi:hypothetical protein
LAKRTAALEAVLKQIKENQKPTIKFSLPKKMTKEYTLRLNKWLLISEEYNLYRLMQKSMQGGIPADIESKLQTENEKRRY